METQKLFDSYVKSNELRKHCLEVSTIMKFLAKELGEDEEKWTKTGLLHDLDFDFEKNPKEHGKKTIEMLKKENYSEDICHAILAHNEDNLGVKRESKFDYLLSAADNVSGLIYAYGLLKKSLDDMDVSGLKKKLKNKAFAAAVRRDLILDAEKFMPLDKFLEVSIKAMQSIKGEIGF